MTKSTNTVKKKVTNKITTSAPGACLINLRQWCASLIFQATTNRIAASVVSGIFTAKGAKNKIEVFEKILKDKGLSEDQIACMGDDIVDIKIMQRSGFSIAPADASEYAKATADYITSKRGGRGAVREVCEMILQAQGKWDEICAHYGMTA